MDDLEEPVRIDIAYGGSCTAGKREDFDHYHAVLAWGLERGLQIPAHVQVFLQYGTTAVRDYCRARGYEATFHASGVRILQPSCGACQLRTGFVFRGPSSDRECHQPEFPRPFRAWAGVAGQPADRHGQCAGRRVDVVGAVAATRETYRLNRWNR